MDNQSSITEKQFFEKIQHFYNQLQSKFQVPIQPRQLNVHKASNRIEFAFINMHTNVIDGLVAFVWWNKNTGNVGWSMNKPMDIV